MPWCTLAPKELDKEDGDAPAAGTAAAPPAAPLVPHVAQAAPPVPPNPYAYPYGAPAPYYPPPAYPPYPPYAPLYWDPQRQPTSMPTTPQRRRRRDSHSPVRARSPARSPKTPEKPVYVEKPANFPLIVDWLKALDEGDREDGQNFVQYTQVFSSLGFRRISELTTTHFSPDCLLKEGMLPGIINVILDYARIDTDNIRKELRGQVVSPKRHRSG